MSRDKMAARDEARSALEKARGDALGAMMMLSDRDAAALAIQVEVNKAADAIIIAQEAIRQMIKEGE